MIPRFFLLLLMKVYWKIYAIKNIVFKWFLSNFKLFCFSRLSVLMYLHKTFYDLLIIITFFSLYHNKFSWIINRFFYCHIFYGSGWLNGETFYSLKGSCLIKNATNTRIFLMLNLGVILLPLLVSFTYSEFVKSILNISSFLTLPHLLDCLICTRNSVSVEFL